MTEAEWMTCTDTTPMLNFLKGKISDRKLRLFACACCRRVGHLLTDERSQNAVELAERYADGEATAEELTTAYYQANVAFNANDPTDVSATRASHLASAIAYSAVLYGAGCTSLATDAVADTVADISTNAVAYSVAKQGELAAQCNGLLDLIGNPFRSVTIDPSWFTPTVLALANGIYQARAFDRMPILADALENAGCDNDDILAHCRQPIVHVRGCWVVDLILGKE